MRLYPQMYLRASISPPATLSGKAVVSIWEEAASRANLVHSNIHADSTPELGIDIAVIEQRARAARSAWVGSKLKSYYQALVRKFERAGEAERDDYLGASQSLADLEERIRRYERSNQPQ
jgi:hypothetical protein